MGQRHRSQTQLLGKPSLVQPAKNMETHTVNLMWPAIKSAKNDDRTITQHRNNTHLFSYSMLHVGALLGSQHLFLAPRRCCLLNWCLTVALNQWSVLVIEYCWKQKGVNFNSSFIS